MQDSSIPGAIQTAPLTASEEKATTPGLCPRCGQPIIDPDGLGWCRACGYCRSLEDERACALLAKTKVGAKQPSMAALAGDIPIWFWILVGGIGAVFAASLAAGWLLPAGKCLPRALWTTLQIAVGLLVVFAHQFLVLVVVAPEDEKLGFKDALLPTRLWPAAARRLPRTAPYLWGASWGLAMVIAALLFIGGLGHWNSYLPGANKDKNKSQTTSKS
jgi:hypothetical protein